MHQEQLPGSQNRSPWTATRYCKPCVLKRGEYTRKIGCGAGVVSRTISSICARVPLPEGLENGRFAPLDVDLEEVDPTRTDAIRQPDRFNLGRRQSGPRTRRSRRRGQVQARVGSGYRVAHSAAHTHSTLASRLCPAFSSSSRNADGSGSNASTSASGASVLTYRLRRRCSLRSRRLVASRAGVGTDSGAGRRSPRTALRVRRSPRTRSPTRAVAHDPAAGPGPGGDAYPRTWRRGGAARSRGCRRSRPHSASARAR